MFHVAGHFGGNNISYFQTPLPRDYPGFVWYVFFFFRTVVVRQVIAPSAFVDDEDADKYMLPTFGCEQIQ